MSFDEKFKDCMATAPGNPPVPDISFTDAGAVTTWLAGIQSLLEKTAEFRSKATDELIESDFDAAKVAGILDAGDVLLLPWWQVAGVALFGVYAGYCSGCAAQAAAGIDSAADTMPNPSTPQPTGETGDLAEP